VREARVTPPVQRRSWWSRVFGF